MAILLILGVAPEGAAQVRPEWQGQAIGTVLATRFLGLGIGLGVRSPGRLRVGTSLSVGVREGTVGSRGELLASYHLDPFRRRGLTPYVGGGVAVDATREDVAAFLVAVLGIEANPAGSVGWFVDGGVGRGLRVSAGARVRRPRR